MAAAESTPHLLDAVITIIRAILECNRTDIDRTYLRELVFGDPDESHYRDALT